MHAYGTMLPTRYSLCYLFPTVAWLRCPATTDFIRAHSRNVLWRWHVLVDHRKSSFLFRNTLIVSIANVLTSIFAGFVIFAYLGYLSYITGQEVGDVVSEGKVQQTGSFPRMSSLRLGPGLAFVVYPYAVTTLPAAPLWSILFFLMLILLGLDSVVSDELRGECFMLSRCLTV